MTNKYQEERAKLLAEDKTLSSIGEVFISSDTANVTILTNHGKRFLVTCEYVELMEPTLPCFQVNMNKEIAKIKSPTRLGRVFND